VGESKGHYQNYDGSSDGAGNTGWSRSSFGIWFGFR
jgi:hypothetical protein